jgi:hypothetical protein
MESPGRVFTRCLWCRDPSNGEHRQVYSDGYIRGTSVPVISVGDNEEFVVQHVAVLKMVLVAIPDRLLERVDVHDFVEFSVS